MGAWGLEKPPTRWTVKRSTAGWDRRAESRLERSGQVVGSECALRPDGGRNSWDAGWLSNGTAGVRMGGGPAGIDALCEDFDNHLRPRSAGWREGVAKKKNLSVLISGIRCLI